MGHYSVLDAVQQLLQAREGQEDDGVDAAEFLGEDFVFQPSK